jgi:hypothetical protein
MRIPLELLRVILHQAEKLLTTEELFNLRLVSKTFNQETLFVVYTARRSEDQPCIINEHTWPSMPSNLKRQYLLFKIKSYKSEPMMFSYLFLAVVEREMAARNIDIENENAKKELIEELLKFVMHFQRSLFWVVTHKLGEFGSLKDKFAVISEMRIDTHFARVCRIILQQDVHTLRDTLRTEIIPAIPVDKASTCFGGSIAEFAVRYGTLEMVTIIHETWPPFTEYHNSATRKMIRAAMSRSDNKETMIQFLMDFHFPEPFEKHRAIMSFMLRDSCVHGHLPIARYVFEKFREKREKSRDGDYTIPFQLYEGAIRHGQLPIIEWLFAQSDVDINMITPTTSLGLLGIAIKNWRGHMPTKGRVASLLQKKGRRSRKKYLHTKVEKIRLQLLADSAVAVLEILLDLGADPDGPWSRNASLPDPEQPSPLFMAAREGLVKGMDLLLKRGADPCRTFNGVPFLVEAKEGRVRRQAVKLLKRYGWDMNEIRNMEGPTKEPAPAHNEAQK